MGIKINNLGVKFGCYSEGNNVVLTADVVISVCSWVVWRSKRVVHNREGGEWHKIKEEILVGSDVKDIIVPGNIR